MCTMTWWRGREGEYGVFFNRDEKKTRSIAEPPRVQEINGTSCIAPRDPDGGGTWILCNAYGVTIAVLNAYQSEHAAESQDSRRWISRGMLPHILAGSRDAASGLAQLCTLDASLYRPFSLIMVDPSGEAAATSDESGELQVSTSRIVQPLVSSSFDPVSVLAKRMDTFSAMVAAKDTIDRKDLQKFHRFTGECPSASTPMMQRSDAQTFSLTEFRIDPDQVQCRYEAYAHDFEGSATTTELSLPSRVDQR
ncbi:MAG: hypothetical protein ACI9R3_000943 [Verrucomicrobiales bacterium]|jgi:hypothetical protein